MLCKCFSTKTTFVLYAKNWELTMTSEYVHLQINADTLQDTVVHILAPSTTLAEVESILLSHKKGSV